MKNNWYEHAFQVTTKVNLLPKGETQLGYITQQLASTKGFLSYFGHEQDFVVQTLRRAFIKYPAR